MASDDMLRALQILTTKGICGFFLIARPNRKISLQAPPPYDPDITGQTVISHEEHALIC